MVWCDILIFFILHALVPNRRAGSFWRPWLLMCYLSFLVCVNGDLIQFFCGGFSDMWCGLHLLCGGSVWVPLVPRLLGCVILRLWHGSYFGFLLQVKTYEPPLVIQTTIEGVSLFLTLMHVGEQHFKKDILSSYMFIAGEWFDWRPPGHRDLASRFARWCGTLLLLPIGCGICIVGHEGKTS
jgi:hypothetical protein